MLCRWYQLPVRLSWVASIFKRRIDCSIDVGTLFIFCQCCDEGSILDGSSEELGEASDKSVGKLVDEVY